MSDYCHGHYRRNSDEDIRRLQRQAAQGDYLAIIRSLHAQIRTGDAWAQHQLQARTAFHALAEASRTTGLPQRFPNDLRIIAAEAIARTAPPRFGYMLRDSGCFIYRPTNSRDSVLDLASAIRVWDHPGNIIKYFYWDGTTLSETTTSQELMAKLETDLRDPALQEWRESYFQPSEEDVAARNRRGVTHPIQPWSLHRVNFPMEQFDELRRELQRQEGYPVISWDEHREAVGGSNQRNPVSLVKYLTAKEFVDEMNYQDLTGKHRAVQPYWQRIADYAVKQSPDPNRPFVQVQDFPLNNLSWEHAPEDRELIEEYSQRSTEFPPIYVSLTDYQLAQDPAAQPKVKNGNHRVVAAHRRGDTVIDAIMTQETWRNIQKLGLRKNPDEKLRQAERQLQLENTFENRVTYLRMRLRAGEISAERVEAAAEIGSLEAQTIFQPTGLVGVDWAINILADYIPLKPMVKQIVLHILASYQNDEATRYVMGTFANPKFDFSSQLDLFFTTGNVTRLPHPGGFIEATVWHITHLLRDDLVFPQDNTQHDRSYYLATAVRNIWFLSNQIETGSRRGLAAEVAYTTLNLMHPTFQEAESQRQFIIECLLGNIQI